ncbi:MAG: S26 family signal peptidase [Gemmataceae bacterium]
MSKPDGRPEEGIASGAPPGRGSHEVVLGAPKPGRAAPPPYARPPEIARPKTGDSGVRETVETVVFVVVLVLLLKTFLAEAFVIPTGSMATTLLGYHMETACDKCGYKYVVNASSEAEGDSKILGSWCPNCQAYNPPPGAGP